MSRFVRPDTVTIPLTDGDTITVRKWLTEGEQRAAYSRIFHVESGRVNSQEVGIAMVLAYLLDWTLVDDEGRLVIIRDQPEDLVRAALDQLYPEDFNEIREAIRAHEEQAARERAEKKKATAGARASVGIS
jgi:hypothetical protein